MTKAIRGRIERLELSSEDPAGIAERLTAALDQIKRDPERFKERFRRTVTSRIAVTEAALRDCRHVPPVELRVTEAFRAILRYDAEWSA